MQALCTSMEVDSTAVDECKESDGGALLQAADSDDGGASAAPLQQPLGAPWRLLAAGVARQSGKRHLCALCSRDLAKCKGKLHLHPPGRICSPCYKVLNGYQPAPVDGAAVVARSHKKAATGKPAADTLAPPPQAPRSPPRPQSSYHTHGWASHASTRSSRAAAQGWLELAEDDELQEWDHKRGDFFQHDTAKSLRCSFLDEKRVRLRHSIDRVARQLLFSLGVDASEAALRLGDVKLLRSSKGRGKQEIHFDITEYDAATQCYTVVLYLTPARSTAVPVRPLEELRECFSEGETSPSAAALRLLTEDQFCSWRVDTGDMLAFNCAVPHFGVANEDEHDRHVLFLQFFPPSMPKPDSEQQRYPRGVKH